MTCLLNPDFESTTHSDSKIYNHTSYTSLRLNKIKFKEWLMILHGGKIYFVAYASLVLLQSIPPNQSPEYLGLSFLLSSEIIKTNFQTIFWCLQDMY